MKAVAFLCSAILVSLLGTFTLGHFGTFNVAADDPHWPLTTRLLEWGRERSIAVRADEAVVPDLSDPDLLISGGPDYHEMCSGCHQKPGGSNAELAEGLYPHPPNLAMTKNPSSGSADHSAEAARQFWIIKHGLKMTGMPAWGATHDDRRIWAMVAFIRKLPTLTPEQYQILTARSEGDEGHSHDVRAEDIAHDDHDGMSHADHGQTRAADQNPGAVLKAFHAAMKAGDGAAASALMSPELQIYEGGHAERTRAEYEKAHMPGDIEFMKDSKVVVLRTRTTVSGDAAWVLTESRISGTSSAEKPFDVRSTETAVLRRADGNWRIEHLHWSSSPFEKAP